MKWYRCTIVAIVFGVLHGCGSQLAQYDYSQEPDPRKREYVLGIPDSVQISVRNQPELSTQVTIRPDGVITIPLLGDVYAAGKTPTELKQEIAKQAEKFYKLDVTQITIQVTTIGSYRFTVSGEVNSPGTVSLAYYVTVADAIAVAGGFTRFARQDNITLIRPDRKTGEVRRIPIDYTQIANGERPDMNLVLMSGDTLHVSQ